MALGTVLRPPLAVALGAIGGALCRYYTSQAIARWLGTPSPHGTLLINVTGCFLLGVLAQRLEKGALIAPEVLLLAATGFLGSYTTFSTYALESWRLLQAGQLEIAFLLYWLGSPLLGLLGVGLGVTLANWIFPGKS